MFSIGEFVPEKLRLWDECDWAVDSLLPFEYGPSSAETAEGLWVVDAMYGAQQEAA